jgi:hypothetical protein
MTLIPRTPGNTFRGGPHWGKSDKPFHKPGSVSSPPHVAFDVYPPGDERQGNRRPVEHHGRERLLPPAEAERHLQASGEEARCPCGRCSRDDPSGLGGRASPSLVVPGVHHRSGGYTITSESYYLAHT